MGRSETITFGNTTITKKEFEEALCFVRTALKGRKKIDVIGKNILYHCYIDALAEAMKIKVKYHVSTDNIAEKMISDALLITSLPEEKINELQKELHNKKYLFVAKQYVTEENTKSTKRR